METSSADGTKDAMFGLIIIIVLPILSYFLIMNTETILDNAFWIILITFLVSGLIVAIPRIQQMIATHQQDQPQNPEQKPPTNQQEDGQISQTVDLETTDGITLPGNQ